MAIAVIGGGIAGLACACNLADAGGKVILLEATNRLGGRAHSFRDKETGIVIDNAQHVLLGCCKEAIRFLSRIGSIGLVDFRGALEFVGDRGEILRIKSSILPPPLHLAPCIIGTSYLSGREKLDLAGALARTVFRAPGKEEPAKDYLAALGCSSGLLERVVEPILVSALNEDAGSASAAYARMVLLSTLLGGKSGYRLGVPKVPLSELIEAPSLRYLAKKGCEVRLLTRVKKLNIEFGRVRSILLESGENLNAESYICAVPPWSLADMGFGATGLGLEWRPIAGVHLFMDGAGPDFDCRCVVGEPFGWVFNKSRDFGLETCYLQAVASAADGIVDLPGSDLVNNALRAVEKAWPEAGDLAVKRALVYRARRATFSTGRGADALRPPHKTPIRNLYLAGDWTDTRWPATMESAVRSGTAAAREVIGRL